MPSTTITIDPTEPAVYIGQDSGGLYYTIGIGGIHNNVGSGPITLINADVSQTAQVFLETDLTISNLADYFIIDPSGPLVFDGQGKSVTVDSVAGFAGLFFNAGSGQTVQNINLNSAGTTTLDDYAGAIVKNLAGGTVLNCASAIDIAGLQAGGIVGANANGTISNCHSSGLLSGNETGGIAGAHAGNLSIADCYTTGAIWGTYSGGIAGSAAGSSSTFTVIRCFTAGEISGPGSGGILGAYAGLSGNATADDCFSIGNISGDYAGGIAGKSAGFSGTFSALDSYSTGLIAGYGAGGIVGSDGFINIVDVFSTGTIAGSYSGGVAGYYIDNSSSITHAYTSGAGFGIDAGGIVGGELSDNSYGFSNYSEANHSASGWNSINANSVLILSEWVTNYGVNTPYTLVAYSPTVNSSSDFSGATAGEVYEVTFAEMLTASGAADGLFNTVQSFLVSLDASSGSYYSGTSYAGATPMSSSATIDATHNLYWVPNQGGSLSLGSAIAVGYNSITNSNFNSVISSQMNATVYSVLHEPMVIQLGHFTANNEWCGSGEHQFNVPNCTASINFSSHVAGFIGAITQSITIHDLSALYQTTSSVSAADGEHALPFAKISENLLEEVLDTQTVMQPLHYLYACDFRGYGTAQASNELGNTPDVLIINNSPNQTCLHSLDLSNFKGLAIVGEGINIGGLTAANNAIVQGDATYTMSAGNEMIVLKGGGCTVNGGLGVDTAYFADSSAAGARVTETSDNSCMVMTNQGLSILNDIERLRFNDGVIALDTGVGENAGEIFRLYQAMFGRTADATGTGFWLDQIDNGATLTSIANQFLASQESQATYGSVSDLQFINLLYQNVLHRTADGTGFDYWQGVLNSGTDRATVLASFSESHENVIGVAAQITNGVAYQPWLG